MSLSQVFIRRPIANALLMAGILVFGLASFALLPIAALPNVDFPTIVVQTNLPGASPQTMASSVATPLAAKTYACVSSAPWRPPRRPHASHRAVASSSAPPPADALGPSPRVRNSSRPCENPVAMDSGATLATIESHYGTHHRS
jgi:AcrB/AcrD/AcrF family protein